MTEMRILTVRQPWAWAIIHGSKDVENRVRNIAGDYRGPIAIHAGAAYASEADMWPAMMQKAASRDVESMRDYLIPYGQSAYRHIIGVVDLTDVHSASVIGGCGFMRHDCPEHGTCRDHCSVWAEGPSKDGWYQHLVLENPRPLAEPIPYRGALGLRRLDDETIAKISAQIGGFQ